MYAVIPDVTILYSIQLYDAPVPKMFAPVTSEPAAGAADGAAVVPAGATVPPDGAAVVAGAAGVAGVELVHPEIETATTTKIIANKLMCENFIGILPVQ